MESAMVAPPKRRGRKRKKVEIEDVMVDGDGKKKAVATRSLRLVGRYVRKEFEGSGLYLGKITAYESGLYRINYEDGDFEDLDSGEVKMFLVEDCDLIDEWLERREKLDKLLIDKDVKGKVSKAEQSLKPENVNQIDSSLMGELKNGEAGGNGRVLNVVNVLEPENVNPSLLIEPRNGEAVASAVVEDIDDGDADADSSNESCEDTQEGEGSLKPLVPSPELPPSSGHIGVPEEFVSHLFCVYSFLRCFSVPLFLYPFGLDEFVGALNCSVTNTLLDSIHVALLHVLKRHIERLSSEGSELALKCMRCLDWNFLDNLTWPIYMVHYLVVMGYKNGSEWKEFFVHSIERDYYSLSAGKKLTVLQILCDDLLCSEELRAEMDMREESEVGIEMDTSTIVKHTGASRRVHPRYSTTSVSKDIEAIKNFAEHHAIKSSLGSHPSQVGGPVESSASEDANGDECRICGMDGLLLCCDGCPSSYHSRCIGLNKMHMPEGSWYCPECKINATEPVILQGTTLRGGHNFGVDPYGQVFVAACDHLLVLNVSIDSGLCLRYYNRLDVHRVLHVLCSKAEHVAIYKEICRGVMQYWQLPEEILPDNGISEVGVRLENSEVKMTEVENTGSFVNTISAENMADSNLSSSVHDPVLRGNSLDKMTNSVQKDSSDSASQQSVLIMNTIPVKSTSSIGLIRQPAAMNELSQQSTSNISETVMYATRGCSVGRSSHVNGAPVEAKTSLPSLELNDTVHRKSYGNPYHGSLYMGSSFKTNGYINNYMHGDFAASAAANLAIIASEENQVLESRSLNNRRKVVSDNISLQVKAFSSAPMRFFWPNSEKKLVDIPRERCSWCFSCKASVASKRGCLLNAAVSIANRGAAKVLTGGRPLKNGDGRLPSIAAYIMLMEESLSGLVVGPFLNDTFRKRWRKQVEQATTCNAIKILLLELEENIRTIALSGDWTKLVDGCSVHSSTSEITMNAAGSTQKRRPGRRGRKPAVVEVASEEIQDTLTDFTWWRGGTLSRLVFPRGVLPCSMIRKAARQGGSKKIPGIHYAEGIETPKSSTQLIWRSAVEMSRNTAQLALQVRSLDFHVRWSDLVRPEQNPLDGKGPDAEASAFRNASVCDKKIVEHEIRYCIAFGSQKHLPSRLMKIIAEIEQNLDDGKERYWFSETRIPLYLIKEYEGKFGKINAVDMSKLQMRQGKASRMNIFLYLVRKQDNMVKANCPSCHHDVPYRDAVKCTSCQGFCHEQCTTSSTVCKNEEVEFLITCKYCSQAQAITQVQTSYGSPTSPLLLQGQDFSKEGTARKRGKLVGNKGPSAPVGTMEYSSEMKSCNGSATAKKSNNKNWGLIWRKKNCEDTGIDFRLKNILLRGNPDMNLTKPVCRLCSKPYNADLMYVCCEKCKHWFHADALELDESKIFGLLGFKCSRCRRIKHPVCPYMDPEKKKALEEKMESKVPKLDIYEMDFNSRLSEHLMEEGYSTFSTKEEVDHAAGDGPLVPYLSKVEQSTYTPEMEMDYEWSNSNVFSGPRKLPVRRHIKQEDDINCPRLSDPFQLNNSTPSEANTMNSTGKLPIRRHTKRENNFDGLSAMEPFQVEVNSPFEANAMSSMPNPLPPEVQWDVSKGSFDDVITLDYNTLGFEDMDFEPQTYFSFNELLASDEGGRANANAPPEDASENLDSMSTMLPENGTLEISYDEEEPIISIGATLDFIPCNICSHTDPYPDLSCQMCGVWIHSQCSPWPESSSWDNGWRCGNCRNWN